MKIEIVPHPNKTQITLPDRRAVFQCKPCGVEEVEPHGRPSYKPVHCSRCKQPCEPMYETTLKDQMAVSVEGSIVAYCKAEPDGWIAQCQSTPLAEYIRGEIKKAVDAKYKGDSVWTDGGLVVASPEVGEEEHESGAGVFAAEGDNE